MRITHLDYILSQETKKRKRMNIDDLFDTVFAVNNINGNRLRKKEKKKEKNTNRLFSSRLFAFTVY
jgi:hypothetical protein